MTSALWNKNSLGDASRTWGALRCLLLLICFKVPITRTYDPSLGKIEYTYRDARQKLTLYEKNRWHSHVVLASDVHPYAQSHHRCGTTYL